SSSYGIDPLFLKAVIQTESQWNDRIVSAPTNTPDAPTSQNSAGIMRFIPATARKYGLNVPERGYVCTQKNTAGCDYVNDERFNPEKSIEAALKYLSAIKTFLSNNNYEVTDENIYLAYFMGEDNFRKYPGRDKVPPGWTDTLNAVNNFNKNLNLIKSSCGGTGGYQTVPAGAIQLKKLSQYGGGFIVDVDPRYFDIKTLSAKTVREDIGGGDCAKYCYGNIVDLKRTVPALNIIAGINAAYLDWVGTGGISDPTQRELYEKYGRPVGDYVEDGKFIKGKYEAGFNNYFVVENGIPQITSEFSFSPSVSSAVAGARDSGVRARTVVCTTADGRVKLVVVSSSSLSALTEYLTPEEKCSKVLNLDGGGSTQFYYDYGGEKVEDAAIESPGIQTKGREVADFIVVVPKAGVSYGSPSLCPSAQFINSPEEEILYAAYRILPSFAVSVEQPLDPYVEVQETIRGALNDDAKCGKDKTPECLARNLQNSEDFNYYFKSNREYYPNNAKNDWNDYCEQGQEEFFADFAEFFDLCINAEQGCSCKLTGVNTNALGSESIKFTKVSEARYDASLLGYDDLIFYTPYLSKFPVEIKSGFTFVYPNEQKTLSTVYINKKGNQLEFSSAPTGPVCKNIENSMVKVCVVSKNPVSEEKHLVFRFAFEPEAVPPPDVNNVQAQDLQRAKQSILVSWDGSTAKNVVAYNIYAQNSEFKGKESEKIKESLAGLQPTRLETINSQDVKKINDVVPICSPAGVKSCIFDFNVTSESSGIEVNSKIRASPQTLIHESDTNKYYYILETEDGVLAYYGVTAINKKELESLGFLETPAAVSVDDIPPGHVYTTQTPVDDTVTLDWARPGNNIDGSELSPTASLNYALYSMCGAATEFTEYGLETPSTQVLQLP
ncbi:transglycosylase SLT domain-containing protein, partial [Candidatus Woesearchaeota archaeon]|nr:transglycosylase SLT domain-containing protein [Candidatus Woesearchaeota archaeon]